MSPYSRGAFRPSFVASFARLEAKGRREGRAPAGTRDPCALEMHTGWITGDAGRPAFPARMVLTVSFVLSPGSDALLPPSSCGWLMYAPGRAAASPQGLTHRPRASGLHDFSVRGRLRLSAGGWRVLTPGDRRTRCDRIVSCRVSRGLTVARPVTTQTAPALPRPPHPGPHLVTIAKRPFGRAGMRRLCHKSEIRESGIFLRGGIDGVFWCFARRVAGVARSRREQRIDGRLGARSALTVEECGLRESTSTRSPASAPVARARR
ncbi:hypothetical protein ACVWYH_009613 [Bradyrhizobium sp. GM24.11]